MKKLTLGELVSIGIGGMIGGGIFAVLGLSIQLSGGFAPIAFLIAGSIALLTSYSYHKLSLKIDSEGGTVSFLNYVFGKNILTGWLNILLWVSYLIMLSLYSYAFGSYFMALFGLSESWRHFAITLPLFIFFLINLSGSKAVGRAEKFIVAFKVVILLIFIAGGAFFINSAHFTQHTPNLIGLISGGMVIFLAYEGFELIANASKDARSERELALSYYISVISVIAIYFFVALITVGTLSYSQVLSARDYALAEAAKPFLGVVGFAMISIAALFSTSSAINATLYGSSRISYVLMKVGEFPKFGDWRGHLEGLVITTLLSGLIANLFNLSSISIMGSAGFLIIFSAVNFAAYRIKDKIKSIGTINLIGGILCLISFVILLYDVFKIDSFGVLVFLGIMISTFVFEIFLEKFKTTKKLSLV